MSDHAALERLLQDACGQPDLELTIGVRGERYAQIAADRLVDAVGALMAARQMQHLSAITALDDGDRIQVLYHLWIGSGLTLRVMCSRSAPAVPSLSSLCPAALWYEREAHEMLGIVFEGHPNPEPLLLPEEWDGPPPLRKEDLP